MPEPEVTIWGMSMGQLLETRIPLMTEVAPDLWVGGAAGTKLPEHIKHYVSLIGAGHYLIEHPVDSVLMVHWEDDENQALDQADAMAAWVNSCTGPVLVHCGAGLNRSCVVAAKVLMQRGHSADDAIRIIRDKRSEHCLCNPHFARWLQEQG